MIYEFLVMERTKKMYSYISLHNKESIDERVYESFDSRKCIKCSFWFLIQCKAQCTQINDNSAQLFSPMSSTASESFLLSVGGLAFH